ncbi:MULTISPECIES: nickel pincer cofactor biosynthesis protein LarB [Myxococcus]|uniref:1-(5-phosphoribosyl)-5-amino-4-imidazole-carboxylate carboxylase n=2 Tax=Myxococcus TaxID=32 RepID=A0A4Y6BBB3_MYXXA|nr:MULTISPECIES: nickel pincer cofactor biosynthesis protein LarB [Myxococcus]NOJ78177.1 nickel pincer cofactor biosynthesis protein LarB [Myxococcus xanthus]NOJ85176.1 nickel pincer cofactor biosynthesis protein LarB [Myxococcus xanthus]NOK06367.1 nickel pincer cofactor biosynthesis protein LarB [Myxococcus xanthus]QDE71517.1 1-(5-phosphoribosyl)-5-amino-4-imidazole-carboxylate carboxylase [Myxococcus xanthus]QDE78798.1 1-(5-phosphoribosyl)-5-amino-4-imidazole-carboxylate carboxylase [Myxococ
MDEKALKQLLGSVKSGRVSVDDAVGKLKDLPFAELGYATLDTHRNLRFGFPEVVLGEPKTVEQLLGIVGALVERKQTVLVTRLQPDKAEALVARFPKGEYHPVARIFHLKQGKVRAGRVAVVTAGTSDIPVAEEAATTAEAMGAEVRRVYDVGVAGIHRLLRRREEIQECHAAVVVAGMEGALASALGGLVGIPVVAVPTSVGYGANFKGVSALLAMVNSCASNVATVNIDNGFGGGFYAALISRTKGRR